LIYSAQKRFRDPIVGGEKKFYISTIYYSGNDPVQIPSFFDGVIKTVRGANISSDLAEIVYLPVKIKINGVQYNDVSTITDVAALQYSKGDLITIDLDSFYDNKLARNFFEFTYE
jgi:hypothetical protein